MKQFKTYISAVILFLTTNFGWSQDLDFTAVLNAGIEDTELYLDKFINPVMKGVGFGLANGWYNTAKPHKLLGFDVTANASIAFVPDKDLFFNVEGFDGLSIESGPEQVPTVVGPESNTTLLFSTTTPVTFVDPDPASPTFNQSVTREEVVSGDFDAPAGVDLKDKFGSSFVPVPMVQLGIGLVKNTEIKLRFMPSFSTDDFKFNFFGVGVLHDFKQWTPGISHLPFDMSGFVGFTKLSAETDFSDVTDLDGSDQVAEYDVTSVTLQVVASKKLSVLTVYGGFGYSVTNSNLKLKGIYVITGETDVTKADGTTETVETSEEKEDPIDLNFKSTGPRATLGLRLKLLVFTLHADYTIQEYNTLTAGFGINVR